MSTKKEKLKNDEQRLFLILDEDNDITGPCTKQEINSYMRDIMNDYPVNQKVKVFAYIGSFKIFNDLIFEKYNFNVDVITNDFKYHNKFS